MRLRRSFAAGAGLRGIAAAAGGVERVTAANIGQEPVRYVRNIYKYYMAYKLLEEHEQAAEAAKNAAAKSP